MGIENSLIGRRIVEVRGMTAAEAKNEGWDIARDAPVVLVLDDGTKLYPSMDEEGNGPGALFGENNDGRHFSIGATG